MMEFLQHQIALRLKNCLLYIIKAIMYVILFADGFIFIYFNILIFYFFFAKIYIKLKSTITGVELS